MPDMKSITIAGKEFPLAIIYAPGQTMELSEGEAHALNQTRHENIRNALAKKVKEWTGDPDALAAEVAKYDEEYEFGVRRSGGGASRDPIAVEARSLARAAIKEALKQKGTSATAEALADAVERLLASDQGVRIKELAAARVAERQQAAESVLGNVTDFLASAPA